LSFWNPLAFFFTSTPQRSCFLVTSFQHRPSVLFPLCGSPPTIPTLFLPGLPFVGVSLLALCSGSFGTPFPGHGAGFFAAFPPYRLIPSLGVTPRTTFSPSTCGPPPVAMLFFFRSRMLSPLFVARNGPVAHPFFERGFFDGIPIFYAGPPALLSFSTPLSRQSGPVFWRNAAAASGAGRFFSSVRILIWADSAIFERPLPTNYRSNPFSRRGTSFFFPPSFVSSSFRAHSAPPIGGPLAPLTLGSFSKRKCTPGGPPYFWTMRISSLTVPFWLGFLIEGFPSGRDPSFFFFFCVAFP